MAEFYLTLQFSEEEKNPFLLDVTSLMYDLELAHDLGVLLTEPEYRSFKFSSQFFRFRGGRRIGPTHRLRAVRIVKQSPLLLEIASSVGGLCGLLQIIEKVSNWLLSREKLELEVDKLRRERDEHRDSIREKYIEQMGELGRSHEAARIEKNLVKRLSESSLKLTQVEIRRTPASNEPEFESETNQ
jgi:hypothetical protein